jgi:hypothetical protein
VARKVRVGRQVFELKKPMILGEETGARFPCCGKNARLNAGAAAQHVECPACGFPWLAKRKGKSFDWRPDHSAMGRGLPEGVSQKDIQALLRSVVEGLRPEEEAGVEVKWITWRTKPRSFGHGVGFYDVRIEGQDESCVAFLDGFDWLHGTPSVVVIHCIRPNAITTASVLDAMKKRVEEIIGRKELPNNRITPRILAFANA